MATVQIQSAQSLMLSMRFNGNVVSTGTGFVVQTCLGLALITNRHNVTGKDQVTGKHLSPTLAEPNEIAIHHLTESDAEGFLDIWVERVEPLFDETGNPLWVEHPKLGAKADFVLLLLSKTNAVSALPYDVDAGSNIALLPADTVSVIGFPFGLSAGGRLGVWATGFVASEPEIDYDKLPLILIDCRTRQGQSGSPVIAFRTGQVTLRDRSAAFYTEPIFRFVGIYSGRVNKESDIGMVWKASAIKELIDSLDPTKRASILDYRQRR